jgi:hypothetical protein
VTSSFCDGSRFLEQFFDLSAIVRDKDPAEEDVPTVLFPAKEAES